MPHPTRDLADAVIGLAGHLGDELEEALAEHRLTRTSFLVLDALHRAPVALSVSANSSPACAAPPGT